MATPWILYNRYTRELETELIYGEKWLRWAYAHPVGRLATWALAKRAIFSRWYGRRMNRPESAALIEPFIEQFKIDRGTFAEPVSTFRCFNDFFVRRLRPESRPVDPRPESVVFPADGRHLLLPCLDAEARLWAKGEVFNLRELLESEELAATFAGGAAVVSRLAPVDYHRFHFPVAGDAGEARVVSGPLYSVHPLALARSTRFLVRNKRAITLLRPQNRPPVVLIEIGATNVGTIGQTYVPGPVQKGAEKGYFAFGGSCVVTLFTAGAVQFADDLVEHAAEGREVYAHVGDALGVFAK